MDSLRRGSGGSPHQLSLALCREYRCTPRELDEQQLDIVLAHIAVLGAEAEYRKIETARARLRRGRRR